MIKFTCGLPKNGADATRPGVVRRGETMVAYEVKNQEVIKNPHRLRGAGIGFEDGGGRGKM